MNEAQNSKPVLWVSVVSWAAASIPIGSSALVGMSAMYIRLSFGRWPVVYLDTVNAPFADIAVTVTALCALALFPAILLLPTVAVIRRVMFVRPAFGLWAVTFAVGWVLAYTLVVWDPTGFIDWVID
jgi:hypothetical protein